MAPRGGIHYQGHQVDVTKKIRPACITEAGVVVPTENKGRRISATAAVNLSFDFGVGICCTAGIS